MGVFVLVENYLFWTQNENTILPVTVYPFSLLSDPHWGLIEPGSLGLPCVYTGNSGRVYIQNVGLTCLWLSHFRGLASRCPASLPSACSILWEPRPATLQFSAPGAAHRFINAIKNLSKLMKLIQYSSFS